MASKKKDSKTVQPEINIFSITEHNDLDFFPNMHPESFEGQEAKIVQSMKDGAYALAKMPQVEYELQRS